MKIRLVLILIALMMLAGTAGADSWNWCSSGCDDNWSVNSTLSGVHQKVNSSIVVLGESIIKDTFDASIDTNIYTVCSTTQVQDGRVVLQSGGTGCIYSKQNFSVGTKFQYDVYVDGRRGKYGISSNNTIGSATSIYYGVYFRANPSIGNIYKIESGSESDLSKSFINNSGNPYIITQILNNSGAYAYYENSTIIDGFLFSNTTIFSGDAYKFQASDTGAQAEPNLATLDNLDIFYDNQTGNITLWKDTGNGKQGSAILINFTNSTGLYVDAYASPDNTTWYLIQSNITNITNLDIPASAKNQTQYIRVNLKGNLYSTPKISYVALNSESSSNQPSGCSASGYADYYTENNTIILKNANTSTLCTLFYDVNNVTALSYETSTNTYTLTAKIDTTPYIKNVNINISDTNLIFNSTLDDEYGINVGWNVTILNSTLSVANGKRAYVWALNNSMDSGDQPQDGYSSYINGSTFISVWFSNYAHDDRVNPGAPYVRITNSTFRDLNLTNAVFRSWHGGTTPDNYVSPIGLGNSAGMNGLLYNLTFVNITDKSPISIHTKGASAIYYEGQDTNLTFSKITISNVSHNYTGAIRVTSNSDANTTFTDIVVTDNKNEGNYVAGNVFDFKESICCTTLYYKNITINNTMSPAFKMYLQNFGNSNHTGLKVENLYVDGRDNITDASGIFAFTAGSHTHNFYIFNATMKNALHLTETYNSSLFFANSQYSGITGDIYRQPSGYITAAYWYELADINVTDTLGNPISGATITITPNNTVLNAMDGYPVYPVTSKWFTSNLSNSIITDSNGHTYLPTNESGTVLLLRLYQNATGSAPVTPTSTFYSYTISVSKSGYTTNSSVTITPDSSWYRSNPNTYQNTTIIILSDAPEVPATPNTVRNRYYTQSCNDILTVETFFFAIFGVAIICIVTFSSLNIIKGKKINMDFLTAAALLIILGLVVMTTIPFLIELIEC